MTGRPRLFTTCEIVVWFWLYPIQLGTSNTMVNVALRVAITRCMYSVDLYFSCCSQTVNGTICVIAFVVYLEPQSYYGICYHILL